MTQWLAENVLAPARGWEYLKIPGEKLVARDGEYRLQITEELWEAAYFDRVALIAVDHPADVAVYSNEKVGPPELNTRMSPGLAAAIAASIPVGEVTVQTDCPSAGIVVMARAEQIPST